MDQITSISIVVLAVALLLPLLNHASERHPRLSVALKYTIFIVYVMANLYETILFRTVTPTPRYELGFFWSYRASLGFDGGPIAALQQALNGELLSGLSAAHITDRRLLKQIILNILLYIPLGYLVPFTWPALASKRHGDALTRRHRRSWRICPKVVCIGFCASLLTELTQLVFHIGLFEFDDLFNNTLGCLLGTMLYSAVTSRQSGAGEP